MKHDFHHTAIWYDRHTRSWVVQRLDVDGNQVGEAYFSGTKLGAIQTEAGYLIDLYVTAYESRWNQPVRSRPYFTCNPNGTGGKFSVNGMTKRAFIAYTNKIKNHENTPNAG